jgi:NAD dependent epimerase/dehydratase family enzyme
VPLGHSQKNPRIQESRVLSTRYLVDALSFWEKKPGVFISASAFGYYGHQDS